MRVTYTPGNYRETFWTPFQQFRERIGQPFEVLGRNTAMEESLAEDGTPDIVYDIRFEDGTEISAWGEEVCQ